MLIRSVLFVCLFNILTVVQLIFWTPVFFFMSRENCWKVVRCWAWFNLYMHHWLIGTRFEFRGTENIPDGGYIIAAKHQSTWETYTMVLFLRDPSYILKRELMFLPFFGWFAMKADVISVNRGRKSEALKAMTRKAKEHFESGRQIVIYPEGTRTHAYAPPAYKYGISHMYSGIDIPVLPAALNSGLFWPRKGWRLYRGTVVMEFLPMIEPGLTAEQFGNQLQQVIEETSNALMAEAQADPEFDGPKPPLGS